MSNNKLKERMFKLPELPYKANSFPNRISEETFNYHYGKHHQTYITNLNNLIKDTEWENKSLDQIVTKCQNEKIFNNAAQHWNHTFFWHCITPYKSEPSNALLKAICKTWGTLEEFQKDFIIKAVGNFGSGWTWLVKKGQDLSIRSTSNAGNPLTEGFQPILTIDVWEHAYYIDYRNSRQKYAETFVKLIDWNFVDANFKTKEVRIKL